LEAGLLFRSTRMPLADARGLLLLTLGRPWASVHAQPSRTTHHRWVQPPANGFDSGARPPCCGRPL